LPSEQSPDDFALRPKIPDEFAVTPKSEKAESGADMLDFVDEPPREEKRKRPPPPVIGKAPENGKDETLSFDDDVPAGAPAEAPAEAETKASAKERKKKEKEEKAARERQERARRKELRGPGAVEAHVLPALRSLAQPRRLALVIVALALAVVGVLGFQARRTPAGLFWSNKYLPSKRSANAAETQVIQTGLAKLSRGDFVGAREAVAAAAQLIAVLPDDEEVKAFFVLAASELKIEYGQVGTDWDQAKRVQERMKGTRPSQNRARGAFALASGDVPKAKQFLATLGDTPNADLESTWLYAASLIAANESARAAQVLDNALKTRGTSTRLLLLRGTLARDRGQLPEAADFLDRALKAAPDNARAMVELASVRLQQNDAKGASELLTAALDGEVRKTLDAGEEARANMLRGQLAASAHDRRSAEAAYERAVSLDPNSGKVHEAYGEFRLQRLEWDRAARQFEAAIQNGGSPFAYAGAARAYLGLNKLLEADNAIEKAVAKEPGNARYLYLQGRVADAIGKAEEANKKYEAALKAKPDLVEALAAQGLVWVSRNDKAKARERFEAALKVPATNLTAVEDEAIGDLALAIGEREKAREAFSRALARDPDDPVAHSGMGKALAAQGDLAGARKEMEVALSQLDSDASLYYEYGSLLRRMGQSDTALESFRKAVKIDSKDPRYRARLGGLLVERGELAEAEQQLRQAVLLNDRHAEALYFLARALAGRKNMTESVDLMKKAVEIEPDNPEFLYHLGLIYEKVQQVRDAIEMFSRAIKLNDKNADAYEHLGLNLMVENRFAEAVKSFKRAAELDPKRARLWALVADAEQQSGDLDGAIEDFQRALAKDGNLPGVWTKLGIAYKDRDCTGCRRKAVAALERATHIDPGDALAHHELGYMFKDDGRRRDAIEQFKRYLQLRPDAGDIGNVQDDIYYLEEELRRSR
jgi:Tfp pilus assembly protein PilF